MMTAAGTKSQIEFIEVAIVGGGPGGLAAAACLAEYGIPATLIDEQPDTGGQFLRRPPKNFKVARWLQGPLYRNAKALLERVDQTPSLDRRLECTIYGITPSACDDGEACFKLWIGDKEGQRLLFARKVIVATGACELAIAFPGWTLAGVMGAGAVQTFLKSQQILPGTRFVLAGSHPLQLIVADQILNAGGEIAMLAFSQSRRRLFRELVAGVHLIPGNATKFLAPAAILARLTARRIPIGFGHVIAHAHGGDGLEQVSLARLGSDGLTRTESEVSVACDTLGICYGFAASGELLRQAGASWRWDQDRGGWLAAVDGTMRTDIPGLYAAGETTGVDGADAAMIKGRLAALACLEDRGEDPRINTLIAPQQRRLHRELRFARFLRKLAAPPWPALDAAATAGTPICRCEGVTKGDIESALGSTTPPGEANALKLATRAGMGLCQGRLCGAAIARLVCRASGEGAVPNPPLTARLPAKPARIGSIATLAEPSAQ